MWRGLPSLQSRESSRLFFFLDITEKAEMTLGSAGLAARATSDHRQCAPLVQTIRGQAANADGFQPIWLARSC
jgi:hypothetical protein